MRKKYARRKEISHKDIEKFGRVLLTKEQYNKLVENFGEDLVTFAIKLLDDKIKANNTDKKLCNAKNHYQYFRSDSKIISFALEVMNSSEKYGCIFY